MHYFWFDYVKPKYREKSKSCYMDTDNFIVYVKTEDIVVWIARDVEARFDTSSHELEKTLPEGKNKTIIGLMKDELVGKTMRLPHSDEKHVAL